MKCELSISPEGHLVLTDESGFSPVFGPHTGGMLALLGMVKARQSNPHAKLGEPGKPSAVQINEFLRQKARTEVVRKAALADEILALINLDDLDLSL